MDLRECECGDSDPRMYKDEYVFLGDFYCISCNSCGSQGEQERTEKQAIDAWNEKRLIPSL